MEVLPTYPKSGWVEHDAEALVDSVGPVVAAAMAEAGISGDRDRGDRDHGPARDDDPLGQGLGQALGPAIVWQDRRTADVCEPLRGRGDWIAERTGLVLDPYFSATKIAWLLDDIPGARGRAEPGRGARRGPWTAT